MGGKAWAGLRIVALILSLVVLTAVVHPVPVLAADPCVKRVDSNWSLLPEIPSQPTSVPTVGDPMVDAGTSQYRELQRTIFRADPDSSSRMFATDGVTLTRSLDGGCTWTDVWSVTDLPRLPDTIRGPSEEGWGTGITAVEIPGSRLAPKRLYLIVADYAKSWVRTATSFTGMRCEWQDSLLVSHDDGETFSAADQGLPENYNLTGFAEGLGERSVAFAIAPSDPSVLYAIAKPGPDSCGVSGNQVLYRSTDAGSSWVAGGSVGPRSWVVVDPIVPKDVWVGISPSGPKKLGHSTDGGSYFEDVELPADFDSIDAFAVYRASPDAPGVVLASDWSEASSVMTIDAGETWQETPWPVGDGGSIDAVTLLVPGPSRRAAFLIKKRTGEIFRFDLRPQRWVEIPRPNLDDDFYALQPLRGRRLTFYAAGKSNLDRPIVFSGS